MVRILMGFKGLASTKNWQRIFDLPGSQKLHGKKTVFMTVSKRNNLQIFHFASKIWVSGDFLSCDDLFDNLIYHFDFFYLPDSKQIKSNLSV